MDREGVSLAGASSAIESCGTERLLLGRIRSEDVDDWCAMDSEPRVMLTLGGVRTRERTRETVDELAAQWEDDRFGWWTLRAREGGAFVGRGGVRRTRVADSDAVEVGYALMPDFWGRGLATEIARFSVRVAFEELALPELVAFTLTTNLASQRVIGKSGFVRERNIMHADLPHVLYRLRAREWAERRS